MWHTFLFRQWPNKDAKIIVNPCALNEERNYLSNARCTNKGSQNPTDTSQQESELFFCHFFGWAHIIVSFLVGFYEPYFCTNRKIEIIYAKGFEDFTVI